MVQLMTDSAWFREQWNDAVQNYDAGDQKELQAKMCVFAEQSCGLRLSQWMWFVRISEWMRLYTYSPKSLGFKTMTLTSESGTGQMEGVVLWPDPNLTLHTLRLLEFWSEVRRKLGEEVVGPENCLRDKEPSETYGSLNRIEQRKMNADRC
jgi:hypothetical protein